MAQRKGEKYLGHFEIWLHAKSRDPSTNKFWMQVLDIFPEIALSIVPKMHGWELNVVVTMIHFFEKVILYKKDGKHS